MYPSFAQIYARINRWILEYRWVLVISIGVLVFYLEAEEHGPLLSNLQDKYLSRELIIIGILMPISWGIMLSVIRRVDRERQKAVSDLLRYQTLSKSLSSASHWDQLVALITQFPGQVAPVKKTSFFTYLPNHNRFELEGCYPPEAAQAPVGALSLSSELCQKCEQDILTAPTRGLTACSHFELPAGTKAPYSYTLPLVQKGELMGMVQFILPPGAAVTMPQKNMLTSAASEMALAVEGATLQRKVHSQEEVAEDTRRRIAQSLHDSVGQNVSYLRLKLDELSGDRALSEISGVKQELERMRDVAEEAYQQVRNTLADLNPAQNIDLSVGILNFAQAASQRANFKAHVQTEGKSHTLPAGIQRQVLFICKEALNNIEKHAQANNVHVWILWELAALTVKIQDDGKGFRPNSVSGTDHFGLLIMQQRSEEIGARLTIRAVPEGQGTEITLRLPLENENFC